MLAEPATQAFVALVWHLTVSDVLGACVGLISRSRQKIGHMQKTGFFKPQRLPAAQQTRNGSAFRCSEQAAEPILGLITCVGSRVDSRDQPLLVLSALNGWARY